MVEVGLGRVDGDDAHSVDVEHGVAVAEELLEVHVADVARVVVSRHDDQRLALQAVEVGLRLGELLLEPERGQVAGADDDVGAEIVDLADRALHQAGHEVRAAAVDVRDVRDLEVTISRGHARSVRPDPRNRAYPGPLLS